MERRKFSSGVAVTGLGPAPWGGLVHTPTTVVWSYTDQTRHELTLMHFALLSTPHHRDLIYLCIYLCIYLYTYVYKISMPLTSFYHFSLSSNFPIHLGGLYEAAGL